MTSRCHRRDFLRAVWGGAAAAALSSAAPLRARGAEPRIGTTPLRDQVTLFTGAGANVVSLTQADRVLLVDGGLEERSRDLTDAVLHQPGARRVEILFNTHWHPEQTGANARLARQGARIMAHANTRRWLAYRNPVPWENRSYGPLPPQARPGETFYSTGRLMFGAEPVDYGYLLQAHTDGDIYVKFSKANVLVTGGAVSGAGWPVIDWRSGGWIGGLVEGLKSLIALADDETRIVPANGPVLSRADLEAQRAMYTTIFDRLNKLLRKGQGPDEVVAAAPTAEFDAQWGDPGQFVTMAFKSLWGHYAPDA